MYRFAGLTAALLLTVIITAGCGAVGGSTPRQQDGSELVGTVWVGGYRTVINGVVGDETVGENAFTFKANGVVHRYSTFFGSPDVLEDEGTWKVEGDSVKMVIVAGGKAYPQAFHYDGNRMWNLSGEFRKKSLFGRFSTPLIAGVVGALIVSALAILGFLAYRRERRLAADSPAEE